MTYLTILLVDCPEVMHTLVILERLQENSILSPAQGRAQEEERYSQ